MQFTNQSMQDIIAELSHEVTSLQAGDVITFDVLDPDEGGVYAGERITIEGKAYIYRGYKSWIDLAELLRVTARVLTHDRLGRKLIEPPDQRARFVADHKFKERIPEPDHFRGVYLRLPREPGTRVKIVHDPLYVFIFGSGLVCDLIPIFGTYKVAADNLDCLRKFRALSHHLPAVGINREPGFIRVRVLLIPIPSGSRHPRIVVIQTSARGKVGRIILGCLGLCLRA